MSRFTSLTGSQRIYRSLLLLYPRAFRQVFGADMVQVFGDRLREEGAASRRGSVAVWFSTLIDLFKSAPLQRMEKSMTREAAFGVLFVLFVAFGAIVFALGSSGPGIVIGLALLVASGIALGVSGALRKGNAARGGPAGPIGIREWWVVLAAVMGAVELIAGIGQLVSEPSFDNALALLFIGGAGILVIAGCWFRSRSRSSGDWMIVVGVLPFAMLFWLIWPPILVVAVMAMALIDSARGATRAVQSA